MALFLGVLIFVACFSQCLSIGQKIRENNNETIPLDLFCYACGLNEIDPEIDSPGSFGDARMKWTPSGKKMYNFSCDIAAEMGLDEKWLRKCPHGVQSCFWSKTTYQDKGEQH